MNGFRAQYMEVLDQALDQAKAVQRDRMSGQMNLFALGGNDTGPAHAEIALPDMEEWPELKKLSYEKETVGFFLTGHPLESVIDDIRMVADVDISQVGALRDGQAIRLGGLIQNFKEHKSKKGDRMAFTVLEDMSASVEVIVFPSTFEQCSHLLGSDEPLIVLGTVQQGERGAKVIAQSVDPLSNALKKYIENTMIRLQAKSTSRRHMEKLKEMLYKYHGSTPVSLTIHFDGRGEVDIEILKDISIRPCPELFHQVASFCGASSLNVNMKKSEIARKKKYGGNGYNGQTTH